MITRSKRGTGGFLTSSNPGHVAQLGDTNTVVIDFDASDLHVVTVDGTSSNVSVTVTNEAVGKSVACLFICENASATVSTPGGWKWVSAEPSTVYAGKHYVLSLTQYSTAVMAAAWAYED